MKKLSSIMKKIVTLCLVAILSLGMFACRGGETPSTNDSSSSSGSGNVTPPAPVVSITLTADRTVLRLAKRLTLQLLLPTATILPTNGLFLKTAKISFKLQMTFFL